MRPGRLHASYLKIKPVWLDQKRRSSCSRGILTFLENFRTICSFFTYFFTKYYNLYLKSEEIFHISHLHSIIYTYLELFFGIFKYFFHL